MWEGVCYTARMRVFACVLGVVATAIFAGCSSGPEEGVRTDEAPLIADAVTMVQRTDGLWDVVCKDGRRETVSAEQIAKQDVCLTSPPNCVDGVAEFCRGPGEIWTGAKCCLPSADYTCVDGVRDLCRGTGENWTGKKCCLPGKNYTCTVATAEFCRGTGENWTGLTCCLPSTSFTCVEGTRDWCRGTGENWTGINCCLPGNDWVCVDGTEDACSNAAGANWTGKKCCFKRM